MTNEEILLERVLFTQSNIQVTIDKPVYLSIKEGEEPVTVTKTARRFTMPNNTHIYAIDVYGFVKAAREKGFNCREIMFAVTPDEFMLVCKHIALLEQCERVCRLNDEWWEINKNLRLAKEELKLTKSLLEKKKTHLQNVKDNLHLFRGMSFIKRLKLLFYNSPIIIEDTNPYEI